MILVGKCACGNEIIGVDVIRLPSKCDSCVMQEPPAIWTLDRQEKPQITCYKSTTYEIPLLCDESRKLLCFNRLALLTNEALQCMFPVERGTTMNAMTLAWKVPLIRWDVGVDDNDRNNTVVEFSFYPIITLAFWATFHYFWHVTLVQQIWFVINFGR